MYCPTCGAKGSEGSKFCPKCGASISQPAPQPQPAQQPAPQPQPAQQPAPQPVQPVSTGNSKTLAILVLIVIVIIVVVAAVLLMGGGGVAGPTNSIICDIMASGQLQGMQMGFTATTKIEKPGKMSMDMSGTIQGTPAEVKMRLDGTTMYMYDSTMGTGWIRIDAAEAGQVGVLDTAWAQIGDKTPEQLAAEMRSSMSANLGVTPDVSCRYVVDIPDSEFQLPPGATVADLSEGGFGY